MFACACSCSKNFVLLICLGGYFTDQFENIANFNSHYTTTGPEIWCQTNGTVDAFVMAAGMSLFMYPFSDEHDYERAHVLMKAREALLRERRPI